MPTIYHAELGLYDGRVVYPNTTDNSSENQSGKIIPFHDRERGYRHDSERIVLSASRCRSCVDLPPHAYLVL